MPRIPKNSINCFLCRGGGKLEVSEKNRIKPKYTSLKCCPVCDGKGYLNIESNKK